MQQAVNRTSGKTWFTKKSALPLASGFAIVLSQASAQAASFQVESESFLSLRNHLSQSTEPGSKATELPATEWLSAKYTNDKKSFDMNGNFELFADPLQKDSHFDLYAFNANYDAIPGLLKVRGGRTLELYRSSRALSVDSLGLDFTFPQLRLDCGAFYGIERSLENGNFQVGADILGAYAVYKSAGSNPWTASTKYQLRTYPDATRSTEHMGYLSGLAPLNGAWSPEIIGDSEVVLNKGNINRVEGGVNFYPGISTAMRLRGMVYKVPAYVGMDHPLFSIFSLGRLYEARAEIDQNLNEQAAMSLGVAYDNYVLQDSDRTHGVRFDLVNRYQLTHVSLRNMIYWLHSYGGDAYGDRIVASHHLSDLMELLGTGEATYYSKITTSKRFALSSQLGINRTLRKNLNLYLGGEANHNNEAAYDFRATLKLTYNIWSET